MLGSMNETFLRSTPRLDLGSPALTSLVEERRWHELPERERIGAIYELVRDEIRFGYNLSDDIPAAFLMPSFGLAMHPALLVVLAARSWVDPLPLVRGYGIDAFVLGGPPRQVVLALVGLVSVLALIVG